MFSFFWCHLLLFLKVMSCFCWFKEYGIYRSPLFLFFPLVLPPSLCITRHSKAEQLREVYAISTLVHRSWIAILRSFLHPTIRLAMFRLSTHLWKLNQFPSCLKRLLLYLLSEGGVMDIHLYPALSTLIVTRISINLLELLWKTWISSGSISPVPFG